MNLYIIIYSEKSDPDARERKHIMSAFDEFSAVTTFKIMTRGHCRVLDVKEA